MMLNNCPNCGARMIPGITPASDGWCSAACDLHTDAMAGPGLGGTLYAVIRSHNIDATGLLVPHGAQRLLGLSAMRVDAFTTQHEAFMYAVDQGAAFAVYDIPAADVTRREYILDDWYVIKLPFGYNLRGKRIDG